MKNIFCHCFYFFLFVVYFFLPAESCYGQNSYIDSLSQFVKTSKNDTAKVKTLHELFLQMEFSDSKQARSYLDQAMTITQRSGYKKGIATTYMYLGYLAEDKADYSLALKEHFKALELQEEMNDDKGIAGSYNNIGLIYSHQGNYPEALKSYFASLKIREKIGDKKGISGSYNNIGLIYYDQAIEEHDEKLRADKLQEALKNDLLSLKLRNEINDKAGLASSYNSIGSVYGALGNYKEALKNHQSALMIYEALGESRGIAYTCNNIASAYYGRAEKEQNESMRIHLLDTALKKFFVTIDMEEAIGDKAGISATYTNIGTIYVKENKYSEALKYLIKARDLAKEIGYKECLKDIYYSLSRVDSAKGNYKGAYENNKLYILFKDSLDNEETRRKTIQSQMTFDFEKKEAVANAEHKKELENQTAIADEKSHKQKLVILFVFVGLFVVLVFAGFIFRSLRVTRKQKNIIEEQKNIVEEQKYVVEQQKHLVEEKQKEIIDSINYARRIQTSQLPTEKYIEKNLNRLMKK